jgi:hypothetical protein
LTKPEERAGLTRSEAEATAKEPEQAVTAGAPQMSSTTTPADEPLSDDGSIHARGVNGQITINGDWLTIERKGFFGRVGHSKGDRRIPLASITAVQVRPAGSVANGFIRFTVPGSPELRGGLQNASKDENAVIFKKSQADDFERVRLAVEHYIIAKHSGGAPIAAAPDIPEQIKKLGELREQGLLTDEQFEAKRDELLSRM